MGRYVFKLPDVGEGTAEAEIVAWHVAVGDRVEEDQNLVDVMTDKATVEMTSPVSGIVVSLSGNPGDMAPVGVRQGGGLRFHDAEGERTVDGLRGHHLDECSRGRLGCLSLVTMLAKSVVDRSAGELLAIRAGL